MSTQKISYTRRVVNNSGLAEIQQYEPPQLKENGAGCYIEFKAFDPEQGKLRRKTIKINHIKGAVARRKYGRGLIGRLNEQLSHGWNPWIAKDVENLTLLSEALEMYESFIEKMHAEGLYRRETYVGYKSYLKNLREYVRERHPIYYLYQFDRRYCSDFLSYIFIDRNNSAQTHNNYLGFLKVLSGFLVERGLLQTRPTEGIRPINKRLITKERTLISSAKLGALSAYLRTADPHFLTACYLLFYCFIRPQEMARLKIADFNLASSTVTIPATASKNRKSQTVTVPKKVVLYMVELGIFRTPSQDYLFSDKLRPGREPINPKSFRDHWEKARKALKIDKACKFYSLKDSGITELCDRKFASITVRDQARHSSLEITDIYTRHDPQGVQELIDHDGSL